MIVYGTLSLITTLDSLNDAENMNDVLKTEIEQLQKDNRDLSYLISEADSDSAKEALARERLGLVKPGEIVFVYEQK